MGTRGSFPGVKRPGREAHLHLVPRSRMRGAIPPLPQYVFTAWCLVKHRDNFTSYLYYGLLIASVLQRRTRVTLFSVRSAHHFGNDAIQIEGKLQTALGQKWGLQLNKPKMFLLKHTAAWSRNFCCRKQVAPNFKINFPGDYSTRRTSLTRNI
jgi:hypothetical protein